MTVGIYKIGKEIQVEQKTDFAGWSIEPLNIGRIFKEHGIDVHLLSGIIGDNPFFNDTKKIYDNILLFCGPISLENNKQIFQDLESRTNNLMLFVSDLKLFTKEYQQTDFKTIFWNSIRTKAVGEPFANSKNLVYNGCPQLMAYQHQPNTVEKDILLYFGGGERGRTVDFFEYVYRPEVKTHIKSTTFGYDTRVGRDEYLKTLQRSKYSIVIADGEYNVNGFLNTRHVENMINGVISFVDRKYDEDCVLTPKDDFRRVSSYHEMMSKIKFLESNKEPKDLLIAKQQLQINSWIDGEFVFELYKRYLK